MTMVLLGGKRESKHHINFFIQRKYVQHGCIAFQLYMYMLKILPNLDIARGWPRDGSKQLKELLNTRAAVAWAYR